MHPVVELTHTEARTRLKGSPRRALDVPAAYLGQKASSSQGALKEHEEAHHPRKVAPAKSYAV